jgi:3-(3-hydroxy-phenyl)propionate hydroxylase
MSGYPVVIVGAGPTGMTAAALLAQHGVDVVVFERTRDVTPIPRAVHFDDEVMRIFDRAGFGEAMADIATPIHGMQLLSQDRRLLCSFDREGVGPHGFSRANGFDQPELERVMRRALSARAGVRLRYGVEVQAVEPRPHGAPMRVTARDLETGALETVEASFVLGCDGARSRLREFVGTSLEDLGFHARWMVVDVETTEALPLYQGVLQVCSTERPATYVHVGRGRHRWEFMLVDGDTPEAMQEDRRVRSLLEPFLGDLAGRVTLRRRAVYAFHSLIANSYRRGRLFLLGDAAHQTPPFIGQGMGAGIRDADNLAWKLAWVLSGRAHESLLDTYQSERRAHTRAVIGRAVLLGRVMQMRRATAARDVLLRATAQSRHAMDWVMRGAYPCYARGPAVGIDGARGGEHAPRFPLARAGRSSHLDDVLGSDFGLVFRGDRERVAWPHGFGQALSLGHDVEDPQGAVSSWLDRMRADAVLIRPDKVVMAAGSLADARRWASSIPWLATRTAMA